MAGLAIAVIGQGSPDRGPAIDAAESCGRGLAEAGATVVTGGLGGVMAAASRGARSGGGRVVAVLPGIDRAAANPYADTVVCTGIGEARDLAVVASGDAVIAVGGAWGTLAEIALARKIGRPVILLGSWELRPPGRAQLSGLDVAPTSARAVAMALARAAGR